MQAALPPPPDDGRGQVLITASWAGTAGYSLAAVATIISVSTFQVALVVVCLALFLVGFVVSFLAYAIAINRSREDAIGMGGLFFLVGSAPRRVRWHLMGSFVIQIVVAVATAGVGLAVLPGDEQNVLAFGILVPMYGLGLAGLWAARFGTFAPRAVAADEGQGTG